MRASEASAGTDRHGHLFDKESWEKVKKSEFAKDHAKQGHLRRKKNHRTKKRAAEWLQRAQDRMNVLAPRAQHGHDKSDETESADL